MPPLCRLLLFVWLAAAADVAAAEWPLETADHLFAHYHKIFPNGNRNAASHRWATFILQRSGSMTLQKLEYFFSAFCPISGSPVEPEPDRAWRYGPGGGLPGVGGGTFEGTVYYCCWPCVCDTQAYLKVDTFPGAAGLALAALRHVCTALRRGMRTLSFLTVKPLDK